MPRKRSSKSSAAPPNSSAPSSRRKPKGDLPQTGTPRTAPQFLVIDLSLPSHVVNDRSLFTTYTPSRKLHRTPFGNDIIIEGYGDVHVRTFAGGKWIVFRLRDSWHVPTSPHHFLSCTRLVSQGKQVIFADRTPRMLFPHKSRLADPELPKYVPFAREGGLFVLKFEIPVAVSIPLQPATTHMQPAVQAPLSLHASSQPFAGLAFNPPILPQLSFPRGSFHRPISPLNTFSDPPISIQEPHLSPLIRTPLFPLPTSLSKHPSSGDLSFSPPSPLISSLPIPRSLPSPPLSHPQPILSPISLISPNTSFDCPSNSFLPSTLASPSFISTPGSIPPPQLPPQSMSFSIDRSPSGSLNEPLVAHDLPAIPVPLHHTLDSNLTNLPSVTDPLPLPPLSWYLASSLSSPAFSFLQYQTLPTRILPPLTILFNYLLISDYPP